MNSNIKTLRDPESRQNVDQLDNPAGMHELEDSALSSITGGCNPGCGGGGGTGPTTWLWSCTSGPCP